MTQVKYENVNALSFKIVCVFIFLALACQHMALGKQSSLDKQMLADSVRIMSVYSCINSEAVTIKKAPVKIIQMSLLHERRFIT